MLKTIKYLLFLLLLSPLAYAQNTARKCEEDLIPKYDTQKRMWGFSNLFGQWVLEAIYTKVTPFVEDKAVVQKGLSYGVIGCDGTVIIPNTFQNMTSYRSGKIWACKSKMWGVLDDKGRVLLEFQYSEINPILHTKLTWVKKDELWGLFDEEKGRLLCKPQFTIVTTMSQNASLVKVNDLFGVVNHVNCTYLIIPEISKVKKVAPHIIVFKQKEKWGLFNEFGVLRLNPEFDSLFMKFPETVVGIKNQKYGLFDLSGKETLPVVYDQFGLLNEGLFSILKDNKYGYATRQGKIVVKPQYQEASLFKNKLAVVRKNNFYGVIDYTNKIKMEFKYESILRNSISGEFAIRESGKPYALWNSALSKQHSVVFDTIFISDESVHTRIKNGEVFSFLDITQGRKVFDKEYTNAQAFEGNFCRVGNGKWGIIDTRGKEIIPIGYDSIINNKWGNKPVWITWKTGRCGVYDTTGKQLFDSQYDSIQYVDNGILKIKKDKLWALVKSNGASITGHEYAFISSSTLLTTWPAIAQKQGKYGLLDDKGIVILDFNYNLIDFLGDNLYLIQKGKQFKIANSKGVIVTKSNYDIIGKISYNLIAVSQKNKWGFINKEGTEIIKPQFEEVKNCEQYYCLVKSKSKWGTIDKTGKIKTPLDYDDAEEKAGKIYLTKNGISFLMNKNGSLSLKN